MSVFLVALLGTMMPMCNTQAWDEAYGSSLESLAQAEDPTATVLAKELRELGDVWRRRSDYVGARKLVAQIEGPIESQVRVEIGALGATTYGVVWLVQRERETILLTNLQGKLSTWRVAATDWKNLRGSIVGAHGWKLPSAADYSADDGTAYFVSICVPEGTGQFVLYAPVLGGSEPATARRQFAKQTAAQDDILTQILTLARMGS